MSNLFEDAENFDSLFARVVGAGSLCWHPAPTGEFNNKRANYVIDQAMERLNQLILDEFAKAMRAIEENNG